MRVYDLAKELGKDSSKEILDILEKHDINLKSSSNITDDQASIVRKAMGGAAKSSEGRQNAPAPAKPVVIEQGLQPTHTFVFRFGHCLSSMHRPFSTINTLRSGF